MVDFNQSKPDRTLTEGNAQKKCAPSSNLLPSGLVRIILAYFNVPNLLKTFSHVPLSAVSDTGRCD